MSQCELVRLGNSTIEKARILPALEAVGVSNAAICYTAMDSIHRSAYVVGLYQGLDAGIRFGGKLEHYEREAKGLSKLDHSQSQNVTKSVNLRHLLVFLATWL